MVVTGAMRDSASADYDGPRNLADAVRCAASDELRGEGSLVVLDGLIVAADDVIKTHTTALDTFQPRDGAAVGRIEDDHVLLDAPRSERRVLLSFPPNAIEDVYLVTVDDRHGRHAAATARRAPTCWRRRRCDRGGQHTR